MQSELIFFCAGLAEGSLGLYTEIAFILQFFINLPNKAQILRANFSFSLFSSPLAIFFSLFFFCSILSCFILPLSFDLNAHFGLSMDMNDFQSHSIVRIGIVEWPHAFVSIYLIGWMEQLQGFFFLLVHSLAFSLRQQLFLAPFKISSVKFLCKVVDAPMERFNWTIRFCQLKKKIISKMKWPSIFLPVFPAPKASEIELFGYV